VNKALIVTKERVDELSTSLHHLMSQLSIHKEEVDGEYYLAESLANTLILLENEIEGLQYLLGNKYKFAK